MPVDTRAQDKGASVLTDVGAIVDRYRLIRGFTMTLCEPLEVEDYVAQSMTDASPAKWHIAHTTWFFEQFVLSQFGSDYRIFHSDFSFLFNSYYNAVGDRVARPNRGLMTRPSVRQVLDYRAHVDECVMRLLHDEESRPHADRIRSLVEIGLNHEQQHQELLLTDIKHLFSFNPLFPSYHERGTIDPVVSPDATWVDFEGGLHWIGHEGPGFAYDNEGPRHRTYLEPFAMSDRLVTNREYLAFIEDGGYREAAHWLDEGWATVQAQGWSAPAYWGEREGRWHVFTLSGLRPLNLDEPACHVSYFEADAFARWSGRRLPTEAEWEVASAGQRPEGNLADRRLFHPAASSPAPPGTLRQLYGDTWEWTRSQYCPYPGYEPEPGALGEYNGKFMCNQFVLRGGSCATHSTHIRPTYRNFFHPAARWQFSGIRLAKDVS